MQWSTPPHKSLDQYEDSNTGLAGDLDELVLTFLDLAAEARQSGRLEDAELYEADAEQARKLRDGEL